MFLYFFVLCPFLSLYAFMFFFLSLIHVSSHSTEVVHQIVALITQVRFLVWAPFLLLLYSPYAIFFLLAPYLFTLHSFIPDYTLRFFLSIYVSFFIYLYVYMFSIYVVYSMFIYCVSLFLCTVSFSIPLCLYVFLSIPYSRKLT